MEQVEFRLATHADVGSLVSLRAAFLAELTGCDPNEPVLLHAVGRYFSATVQSGKLVAHLAEVDGSVVATSGLVYHLHPPSAKNLDGLEAYVMNMYTVPSWRGRGIASALLQRVLAAARQDGCRRVILHAAPKAIPIFSRAGFVAVDTEMRLELCWNACCTNWNRFPTAASSSTATCKYPLAMPKDEQALLLQRLLDRRAESILHFNELEEGK